MIPLLAQANVSDLSNAELRAWVIGLVILLCVAALWQTVFKRTPALNEEFVTRREFEALESRLDAKIDDLSEQLVANNSEGEKRVVLLHDRINKLPAEIINLLRSTKGLIE